LTITSQSCIIKLQTDKGGYEMAKSKEHVSEVIQALREMGYHKTEAFIHRLQVEEDNDLEFSVGTIKEVSFSMLDIDYEKTLLRKLGIAK
jgi:hypothetical protein